MKILVTGATGYVGSRVVRQLAERGHAVTGSVRNAVRLAALPEGIAGIVLDFQDSAAWGRAAEQHDVVIHTAFAAHDADFAQAVAWEHSVVSALIRALADTGRRLILSNGTAFLGDSGTQAHSEQAAVIADHPAAIRAASTGQARETGSEGVLSAELRLASFVYGDGGSVFLPRLIDVARRTGRSVFVGDGEARASTVHVEDAARAYVLAAERPDASGVYHVAAEGSPSVRQIAEAVATAVGGVPVVSVDYEEAASLLDPFTASFLMLNNRLDSSRIRRELGWMEGGHKALLEDVASGTYAGIS
jgi:nucleoside-diphosphate-sugar epimerase